MTLFPELHNPRENLLPFDGEVYYYDAIISLEAAKGWMRKLLAPNTGLPWRADEAIIAARRITSRRKVAWHGDAAYRYRYSGVDKTAEPWTPDLLALKTLVESALNEDGRPLFNSCLANLYHNGSEGMAWHSDAERELKAGAAIACLSLGAPRRFALKHRVSGTRRNLTLSSGSLLIMQGSTQQHWLHSIPVAQSVSQPRISLTFRRIQI